MRGIIVAIIVAAAAVGVTAPLAGCGRQAVRAAEKEFLADQVMVFDDDPHESSSVEHVRTNREGAAGGERAARDFFAQ